ncbi:MAG: sugar phosphate isomerase/epimerase family protein [Spirochaetota bacterium]
MLDFTVSTLTGRLVAGSDDGASIARLCRDAGFVGVEGSIPFVDGLDDAALERVRAAFAAESVRIDSFHLPFQDQFNDDLASLYETERLEAVRCVTGWIDRAMRLGVRVGVVHPTTRKGFGVGREGFGRLWDALRRSLEAIDRHCQPSGFQVAVENVPGADRFGSVPDHFSRFAVDLPGSSVGFCLDTGHALLSLPADPMAFYDAMRGHLVAFHLADNAGDRDSHLAPGRGLVPWSEFAKRLRTDRHEGTLCIETPPFAPGPPFEQREWTRMRVETGHLLESRDG